jgi:hypothetical protein
MKFLDTISIFKHIGGALPIHIMLGIYGLLILTNE